MATSFQTFDPNRLMHREGSLPELVRSRRFGPNLSLARGRVLMESAGVAEVQTLSCDGTPASGSYQLEFNGQRTVALAYNASAAAIKAAIEALPWFVQRGWAVTVSAAIGSDPTVTWTQKEGVPYVLAVVNNTMLTAGSVATPVTVARTTSGSTAGAMVAYASDALATPATPTIAKVDGTSGTFAAVATRAKVAYVNANGEGPLSAQSAAITPTVDKSINIAAITAIPDGVTAVNVYLQIGTSAEFVYAGQLSVTSNATAETVFSTPPSGLNRRHAGDTSRTARAVGLLLHTVVTDAYGRVTHGDAQPGPTHAPSDMASVSFGGAYRVGDLTGFDAQVLADLGGQALFGGSLSDPETIIRF